MKVHNLFNKNDDNYVNTNKLVKVEDGVAKKLDDIIDLHLEDIVKEPIIAILNPVPNYNIYSDRILKKDGWVECFFKLEKSDGTNWNASNYLSIALTDIIPVGYRVNRWIDIIIHGAIANNMTSSITGAGNFNSNSGSLQFKLTESCKTIVIYYVQYVGGGTL